MPESFDSTMLALDSNSDASDDGFESLYTCNESLHIYPQHPVVAIPVHDFSYQAKRFDIVMTVNKNYFYRDEYAVFTL